MPSAVPSAVVGASMQLERPSAVVGARSYMETPAAARARACPCDTARALDEPPEMLSSRDLDEARSPEMPSSRDLDEARELDDLNVSSSSARNASLRLARGRTTNQRASQAWNAGTCMRGGRQWRRWAWRW